MIYADYNATTSLCDEARQAIVEACEIWGNPSSTHALGRKANALLETSRQRIAGQLNLDPETVVFTSGGSESDAMALFGAYWLERPDPPFRLLISPVEHAAVRDAADMLRKQGALLEETSLGADGAFDLDAFSEQLAGFKPHLVSIMAANNETGVVFPIEAIAKLCHDGGTVLHTDAVQAFGKIPSESFHGADLISLSSHKIFGPKGVGALVIQPGVKLAQTRFGGSQETKRRGGTQNVIGIAGFGAAAEVLSDGDALARLEGRRDRFEARLLDEIEGVHIHGKTCPRVPNTTSLRIDAIRSEVLLSAFDLDGLCVSAGSACSSGSVKPSSVLTAMGLTATQARESLRISWATRSTEEEMEKAAEIIIGHAKRIRQRRRNAG